MSGNIQEMILLLHKLKWKKYMYIIYVYDRQNLSPWNRKNALYPNERLKLTVDSTWSYQWKKGAALFSYCSVCVLI